MAPASGMLPPHTFLINEVRQECLFTADVERHDLIRVNFSKQKYSLWSDWMKKKITTADVYDVLSRLEHPEMPNSTLMELGMIAGVDVQENLVKVSLALPSLDVPIKQDLINSVKNAATGIQQGLMVDVDIVEMNQSQKDAFREASMEAKRRPKVSRRINNVIAVMSGKGGVGKSSVAVLLASALGRRGFQVGVLDADITGPSIPMMFGAQHPPKQGIGGILPTGCVAGSTYQQSYRTVLERYIMGRFRFPDR